MNSIKYSTRKLFLNNPATNQGEKMKLKLLLTLAVLLGSFGIHAEDMEPDKSDGCGIGWNIYDKKTILGTSIRATTNNVLPFQASGMTSGTSNCAKHDIVKKDKAPMYFTEANMESLLAEMAEGQGEYLNEYASVLGCQNTEEFTQMTQQNFNSIVPSEETNAVEVYRNVREQIKVNALNCAV